MSLPTESEMHQAHLKWQGEHGAWRSDLDRWLAESRTARDELAEIDALLGRHEQTLRDHDHAVAQHGETLQAHEVALAELEQGGLNERRDEVVGRHFAQLTEHTYQTLRHAFLARQHLAIVRELRRLLAVLRENVPPAAALAGAR